MKIRTRKRRVISRPKRKAVTPRGVESAIGPVSGGEVILYQPPGGKVQLDVRLERDTVWLSQQQMSSLFGRERSVITKHLRNVFAEGELEPLAVCANFAHTAPDAKTYQVEHYSLDVVISVGYRVNSKQGTQFRIWATQTLRDHLLRGYTLNEKRLRERGLEAAQQAIDLLSNTLRNQSLVTEQGRAVLDVVQRYTRAWRLPKISAIRNYKLQGISLERLMHALTALGQHVEIVVTPSRRGARAGIKVAA